MEKQSKQWLTSRVLAFGAAAVILAPALIGCGMGGGGDTQAGGYGGGPVQQPQQGMSTKKKLAILGGAAALYYLWKRSQDKKQAAANLPQGVDPRIQGQQLYLSRNGRVYYRDPRNPRIVHWVTPPSRIQVPEEELANYGDFSRLQGYNGQSSGQSLGEYAKSQGLGFD